MTPQADESPEPDWAATGSVADLIALVDRLEELLERSALAELEVEAGGTTLILRKPDAMAPAAPPRIAAPAPMGAPASTRPPTTATIGPDTTPGSGYRAVLAPLTGVYYDSPSPGAAPYLKEGGQVSAGQVIALIEAMKLFNEIKSDVTGIVRRIAVGNGALVKSKQTLIEVEPT